MSILKNEPIYPFKDGDYTKPRHIMQVVMNVHMLIADAANEPLYVTNHPLHTFPTPDTFLEFDLSKEHNTFSRQIVLRAKFATFKPPYKREDVTALTDVVHCAFIDDKKAEAAPKGRTLINTNTDLSKPNISVRFYLGDEKPASGTNHMEDQMSEFFTFGF
jgi:hypothetical protein